MAACKEATDKAYNEEACNMCRVIQQCAPGEGVLKNVKCRRCRVYERSWLPTSNAVRPRVCAGFPGRCWFYVADNDKRTMCQNHASTKEQMDQWKIQQILHRAHKKEKELAALKQVKDVFQDESDKVECGVTASFGVCGQAPFAYAPFAVPGSF